MKRTGIVRRVDDLGRIVIPRDLRRLLRIKEGDPLEIYATEEGIFMKRYNAADDLPWDSFRDYYEGRMYDFSEEDRQKWSDSLETLMDVVENVERKGR